MCDVCMNLIIHEICIIISSDHGIIAHHTSDDVHQNGTKSVQITYRNAC
jgi:hypothetical protein